MAPWTSLSYNSIWLETSVVRAVIFPQNDSGPDKIFISIVPSNAFLTYANISSTSLRQLSTVSLWTTDLIWLPTTSINALLNCLSSHSLPSLIFRSISKKALPRKTTPLLGPVRISDSPYKFKENVKHRSHVSEITITYSNTEKTTALLGAIRIKDSLYKFTENFSNIFLLSTATRNKW